MPRILRYGVIAAVLGVAAMTAHSAFAQIQSPYPVNGTQRIPNVATRAPANIFQPPSRVQDDIFGTSDPVPNPSDTGAAPAPAPTGAAPAPAKTAPAPSAPIGEAVPTPLNAAPTTPAPISPAPVSPAPVFVAPLPSPAPMPVPTPAPIPDAMLTAPAPLVPPTTPSASLGAPIPLMNVAPAPAPIHSGPVGCTTNLSGGTTRFASQPAAGCGVAGCGSAGCGSASGFGGCGTHGGSGCSLMKNKSCTYHPLFSQLSPFGCGSPTGNFGRMMRALFGARTNFCGPGSSGSGGCGGSSGSCLKMNGSCLGSSGGCGTGGGGCLSQLGRGGCIGGSCGSMLSGASCLGNSGLFGGCGNSSCGGSGLFGNCNLFAGKGGPGNCGGGLGSCGGGLGNCMGLASLRGAGGSGGCGLFGCGGGLLAGPKAYPDAGWSPPAQQPIIRQNAQYTQWWPQQWYGAPGAGGVAAPMVFMPNDTSQLGFGYMQVPTWRRTAASYPPVPDPSQYHNRVNPVPSPYGYPPLYQPVMLPHHSGVRSRTGWHASIPATPGMAQSSTSNAQRVAAAAQAQRMRQYQAELQARQREAMIYQAVSRQQQSQTAARPVSSRSPR